MSSFDELSHDTHVGTAEEHAAAVIARWRTRGFDTVLAHPSGYCSPANSDALPVTFRDGYSAHDIDSPSAIEALASSILAGMQYRV